MVGSAVTSVSPTRGLVKGSGGIATRRGLGVVFLLTAALALAPTMSRAAATPELPKKVGTERIVVDPKPAAPEVPSPDAVAPPSTANPAAPAAGPALEIHKGEEGLPPLVAKMRRKLIDAAYSGDMNRLKIAIQANEMPPIFSINEVGDPIEYLKNQSGDGQGLEILAILTDVLESSWTRINPGTPTEMYVWPAYAALPLERLGPEQMVEVYKIVTSSDFEEMKGAGRWTFYNVGIGPDGTWHWFKLGLD